MNEKQLKQILDYYKSDPLYDDKANLLENVYFQAIGECLKQCYKFAKKQDDFKEISNIQKEYIFYEALYDFGKKEIDEMISTQNYINNLP